MRLDHDEAIIVVFSPDGRRLASAGFDKAIKVWDMESEKLNQRLDGHTTFITGHIFEVTAR